MLLLEYHRYCPVAHGGTNNDDAVDTRRGQDPDRVMCIHGRPRISCCPDDQMTCRRLVVNASAYTSTARAAMVNGGPSVAAQPGPGAVLKSAAAPSAHANRLSVVPNEHTEQKRDLTSWWRSFKRNDKKDQGTSTGSFTSCAVASGGRWIARVISKGRDLSASQSNCEALANQLTLATDVEGIFRLAGSEKRIKELKLAFDSPDRYGKGLDWTGYTVHDAANILRRYFNQLPEPIIPLEFYDNFRRPITGHQAEAVGNNDSKTPVVGGFIRVEAIRTYQALITEIPPLNRQLLLYILDLLAVFASKSDLNKMTTANLSAIFQPGILSHPQHDMAPEEYRLSQDVLIFLIENQDHFLIGMQGTAADPETVRAVQSGATVPKTPSTPTTPTRSRTVVGRSSSNASAGTDSVRKWGGVRRNVSVSSKHSKQSEGGLTPVVASITNPSTPTSGVHRSNTVPSRRGGSGAEPSPRFSRDKSSDPPTPNTSNAPSGSAALATEADLPKPPQTETITSFAFAPPEIVSASSSETMTPLAGTGIGSDSSSVNTQMQTPRKETAPLLSTTANEHPTERVVANTPAATSGHGFLGFLKQSPTSDGDGRKPNKLQKKRVPGSNLSSAQSSSQDLPHDGAHEGALRSPIAPAFTVPVQEAAALEEQGDAETSTLTSQSNTPTVPATPQRHTTDSTLRPTVSPTHSYQSQTDQSDADLVGDDMPTQSSDQPDREKKRHRWRLSRSQNKVAIPSSTPTAPSSIGTTQGAREQASRSTFASSQPRRSFQDVTPIGAVTTEPNAGQLVSSQPSQSLQSSSTDPVFSDSEKEKKGPMSWIRGKIQERKDKEAEKRSKTPERNNQRGEGNPESNTTSPGPETHLPVRGRSIEQPRQASATIAPAASTSAPDAPAIPSHTKSFATTTKALQDPSAVTQGPQPLAAPVGTDVRSETTLTASELFQDVERAQQTAAAATTPVQK
nr:rho-gtpase-activating protein 5 [Quercus suber]